MKNRKAYLPTIIIFFFVDDCFDTGLDNTFNIFFNVVQALLLFFDIFDELININCEVRAVSFRVGRIMI